jgi:hypothetical protein
MKGRTVFGVSVYVLTAVALTIAWRLQGVGPYKWVDRAVPAASAPVKIALTFLLLLVPLGAYFLFTGPLARPIKKEPT